MNLHRTDRGATDLPDLRVLDPAHGGDRARGASAQQLLTRIVATPRTASGTNAEALSPTLATATAVALPALLVDEGSSALASWTAAPTPMPPEVAAEQQASRASGFAELSTPLTAALTERRGDFTFTLVAGDAGIGTCFTPDPTSPVGQEVEGAAVWAPSSTQRAPATDGIDASWGSWLRTAGGASWTSATGRVGDDVTAVEILPSRRERVRASTVDGYFTAWWPGRPENDLSVLLTLRDGTTVQRSLKG